jgi:hypothetical protein
MPAKAGIHDFPSTTLLPMVSSWPPLADGLA